MHNNKMVTAEGVVSGGYKELWGGMLVLDSEFEDAHKDPTVLEFDRQRPLSRVTLGDVYSGGVACVEGRTFINGALTTAHLMSTPYTSDVYIQTVGITTNTPTGDYKANIDSIVSGLELLYILREFERAHPGDIRDATYPMCDNANLIDVIDNLKLISRNGEGIVVSLNHTNGINSIEVTYAGIRIPDLVTPLPDSFYTHLATIGYSIPEMFLEDIICGFNTDVNLLPVSELTSTEREVLLGLARLTTEPSSPNGVNIFATATAGMKV